MEKDAKDPGDLLVRGRAPCQLARKFGIGKKYLVVCCFYQHSISNDIRCGRGSRAEFGGEGFHAFTHCLQGIGIPRPRDDRKEGLDYFSRLAATEFDREPPQPFSQDVERIRVRRPLQGGEQQSEYVLSIVVRE